MKTIIVVLGLLVLSSCAMRYRPIHPESLPYLSKNENSCFKYAYTYGVLSRSRNRRYARKENRHYIKVVAVEITNQTNKRISFKNDVALKIGNAEITPMAPEVVKATIHQNVVLPYLFYGLIAASTINYNGYYGQPSVIIYPIGVPIAIGNMLVAGNANHKFLEELQKYDLTYASIDPGETKYGLVSFYAKSNEPIMITLRNTDCGSDINPTAPSGNEKRMMNLPNLLHFTSADSSYKNYADRIRSLLRQDAGIISFEYLEYKYDNGKIKSRGFKAKHKYGINDDYSYKIGTWEYYNKEGILKRAVNYDLRENTIDVIDH